MVSERTALRAQARATLRNARDDHRVMVDRCKYGVLRDAPQWQKDQLLAETEAAWVAASDAYRATVRR